LNTKVETVGTETIDGEPCYKVVLTPTEAPPETMYFQKKSGLAVKTVATAVSAMGEAPVEMLASDYKNMGGVLVPTKITEKLAGQEITITIQDVKVNQPLPADRFDPPAEIKALLNKAAEKK
jgi:outer membrane lipoprotein-sorting protein